MQTSLLIVDSLRGNKQVTFTTGGTKGTFHDLNSRGPTQGPQPPMKDA